MDLLGRVLALIALVLGLVPISSTSPPGQTVAPSTVDVLRVAVVGDSLSCGGQAGTPGWCPELSRLLTAAGVDHELLPLALGGTRCSYWADHIGQVLAEHSVDLVVLGCGTNDGGLGEATGVPQAGQVQAAVASVAAQVHAAGARLLVGIPAYSSGAPTNRPTLPVWQHEAYQGIAAAWAGFAGAYGTEFSPALFDDTRMPPLSKFVLGDGVHPTSRPASVPLSPMTLSGYDVLAHDRYRAFANGFIDGLPPIPPDCMQIGGPPGGQPVRGIPCYGSPPRGGV